MKKIVLFVIALFFIFTGAQAKVRNFTINVGQFDRLEINNNLEVVYHCNPDSSGMVSYKAKEDLADVFLFSNPKGSLKIEIATEDIDMTDLPVLHVYSDYLTSVSNSSERNVTIASNSAVPQFCVKLIGNGSVVAENIKASEVKAEFLTGNGSITISGACKKAIFKMVGTGTILADRLKAENINCQIMGSGNIGCWATGKLDVRGIGSTKIYYKGDPKIKKVGGGKIIPLTSESGDEMNFVIETR